MTSRPFLPTSSEGFVQFAYSLRSHGGRLELQFELGGIWRRMWRQVGFQTDAWQQVKITLPAGTQRLRFVAGSNAHEKGVDEILAWQPEGPAEFLSLCSGPYHSCAAHVATGDVRCWPWIGTSPDQTDNNLPVIDLGGGRARQVACGQAHNCAVLWDGSLQCWGYYDGHLGNDEIMAVEQVVCGYGFTCALLRGGAVRCFGQLYGRLRPSSFADAVMPEVVRQSLLSAVDAATGMSLIHRWRSTWAPTSRWCSWLPEAGTFVPCRAKVPRNAGATALAWGWASNRRFLSAYHPARRAKTCHPLTWVAPQSRSRLETSTAARPLT